MPELDDYGDDQEQSETFDETHLDDEGDGDFLLDDGVKSRDDSDDAESESLAVNFAAFFDEVLSEELHEEREFAGWSFPVFAGEAVEGELLESEPGGFFDDGAN